MKRLLVLTAVTVLLTGTTGCRCFDWLCRGSSYQPAAATAPIMMPEPVSPCNPCQTSTTVGACCPALPEPTGYGQ